MPFPDYTVSGDITAGILNQGQLHDEIADAQAWTVPFLGINRTGDDFTVLFDGTPTSGEQDTVGVLVMDHVAQERVSIPVAFPMNTRPYSCLTIGWEDVGAVWAKLGCWVSDETTYTVHLAGIYKTTAPAGVDIELLEHAPDGASSVQLISQTLADTADVWTSFQFDSAQNAARLDQNWLYQFRAKDSLLSSTDFRAVTMAICTIGPQT